jgi:hypothetical protein
VSSAASTPSPARAAIPWGRIVLWFVVSRVVMFGLAGLSLRLLVPGPFFYRPGGPLDWFMQWDGRWFLGIAGSGYSYDPHQMSSVNFLPLYPMLMRAVSWVVHNEALAGYIVSNGFCLAAAALLWKFTRELDDREAVADGAVLFFLLGPVAVFFSSLYSESAFIFFALASLWAARRQRWLLAGLCGVGAALSRSVGVLLVLPLFVEFVRAHGQPAAWRGGSTWGWLLCCGLPALATAGYVAYLGWRFGDPMAYVVSQRHGGHNFGMPWMLFSNDEFFNLPIFYRWWFGAAAVAAVIMLVLGAVLRLPLAFTVFSVALCGLYLSTRSLEGLPRFFSVVFPFYITLGRVHARWPALGTVLLATSTALFAFSVLLFVNGYWFT